jgi:hypothetical protein
LPKKSLELIQEVGEFENEKNLTIRPNHSSTKKLLRPTIRKTQHESLRPSFNKFLFKRQETRGSMRTGSQFEVFGVHETKRAILNHLVNSDNNHGKNVFSKRNENKDIDVRWIIRVNGIGATCSSKN